MKIRAHLLLSFCIYAATSSPMAPPSKPTNFTYHKLAMKIISLGIRDKPLNRGDILKLAKHIPLSQLLALFSLKPEECTHYFNVHYLKQYIDDSSPNIS